MAERYDSKGILGVELQALAADIAADIKVKANVDDALAKVVKTRAYNLDDAAYTALYEVPSGNISNAPTGNGDRVVLLAGQEGGLVRQLLIANDGLFWRLGAVNAGDVHMLKWLGPASDERVFDLEYKQSGTGVNYSVHLYGERNSESWYAWDLRFRVTRPLTDPDNLRVHMKITPTAQSANPLYHGSVRALSRHSFGLEDGSGSSSPRLVHKVYNNIESSLDDTDLGQEICNFECKLSSSTESYCGVIEGDVKYYGTSASNISRTVNVHYTVNYTSAYVQGVIKLFTWGSVRCKEFLEYN